MKKSRHRSSRGHAGRVSWRTLMTRHRGAVRASLIEALATRRVRLARDEIEDLTQEVFLRLIRAGRDGDFDPRRRESGQVVRYLKRVIRSLLVDRARSETAQKRMPQPLLDWSQHDADRAAAGEVEWNTPEDRLLARERRRMFLGYCRRQADGLPDVRRHDAVTALRLTVLEGWSSREASRALSGHLTPGQIDLLVFRLRRDLEADGYSMPRRGCVRAA